MSHADVRRFIDGADALAKLVKGLTREQLLATPVPGKWSLQTLALHVLDSDLIATHRMKRVIAEDMPLLISYDETAFAKSLHYEAADVQLAAELFRLNRIQVGQILTKLPDSAFERAGVHNQRGKVTLGEFVRLYVGHVEHHMVFAREKLRALGVPVTV